jgi:hypothetical protein
MGLALCCGRPRPAGAEDAEQGHALIVSSTPKSEIDALVTGRRRLARTLPLLEAAHAPFELTSPEPSSESSIQLSLLEPLEPSPPPERKRGPRPPPDDSEDEGGIAGAMDSTDDD